MGHRFVLSAKRVPHPEAVVKFLGGRHPQFGEFKKCLRNSSEVAARAPSKHSPAYWRYSSCLDMMMRSLFLLQAGARPVSQSPTPDTNRCR